MTGKLLQKERDKQLLHKQKETVVSNRQVAALRQKQTSCCTKREKEKLLNKKERNRQVAALRQKQTICRIKRETDKLLYKESNRQVAA